MTRFSEALLAPAQDDMDKLLERQWRARIELRQNPTAYARNLKWRQHFKRAAITQSLARS